MAGNALTPETAERESAAVELRKAGLDYDAIAAKLGMANRSVAWKVVQRALKRTIKEPAEQVRLLEVSRLDDMHAGLWDQAKHGDAYSVDRVLKIQDRRAKYLGLDMPVKIAPTTPDGTEALPGGIIALLAGLPPSIRTAVSELCAEPDDVGTTSENPGGLSEAD